MSSRITRRGFTAAASAASLFPASNLKPALVGGEPIRSRPFPAWPKFDSAEEKALQQVLTSGKWWRGGGRHTKRFEEAYAKLTGAKHCLATASGTAALFTSVNALDISPGDEVLVPPYTFIATVNVVLLQYALPVFVDTDIETFQMDAGKVAAAITSRTRAIIPVHLGGGAVDVDAIGRIAGDRNLPVIEDACQSHLAEWRGKKVGTLGTTGCFSFQASKNLNSGEGGAVLTNSDEVAEKCYAFQNNSRGRTNNVRQAQGSNERMTEFQAAMLLAQMTRLEKQSQRRENNAAYLKRLLGEIPGIEVAQTYEGCTRNAYHLFMFRYRAEEFAGLPRSTFLRAMKAEGIPCSGGYKPLNKQPFLKNVLHSRGYRAIYPGRKLQEWEERNLCPENDRLCEQAVWLTQTMLLGGREDMDDIASAVHKIQSQADALRRT